MSDITELQLVTGVLPSKEGSISCEIQIFVQFWMLSHIWKICLCLVISSWLGLFCSFQKTNWFGLCLYYPSKSFASGCIWIWESWVYYPVLTSVSLKLTARSWYEIRHCVFIYKIICKRVLAVESHIMKNRSNVPTLHWAALALWQVVLHQLNFLFALILCVMKRHKENYLEHLTCRSQQMYKPSLLPYGSNVLWHDS